MVYGIRFSVSDYETVISVSFSINIYSRKSYSTRNYDHGLTALCHSNIRQTNVSRNNGSWHGEYNYHIVVIVAGVNCILLENSPRDAHTNSINNNAASQ